MRMLERYLLLRSQKQDRYVRFAIISPKNKLYFCCPYCGERNYKEDWDNCGDKIPRCLFCRKEILYDGSY